MKKKSLLLPVLLTPALLMSQDFIVIGPPPITYSHLKAGESDIDVGANYTNYDTDKIEMYGAGANIAYRKRSSEKSLHYVKFSYLHMGSDGTTYGAVTSDDYTDNYFLSYLYGYHFTENFQGFVGANYNYSEFGSEVPYGSQNGADIYVDSYIYGANTGVQYVFSFNFGRVTPWFFASYMLGNADSEMYSSTNSSSSIDIDPIVTTQLGFDIYFNVINSSLSSMIQKSQAGSLLSFTLTYNFYLK